MYYVSLLPLFEFYPYCSYLNSFGTAIPTSLVHVIFILVTVTLLVIFLSRSLRVRDLRVWLASGVAGWRGHSVHYLVSSIFTKAIRK